MLDVILTSTRQRVLALAPELAVLQERASGQEQCRDFAAALRAPGLSIIAEIKRRSPSAGDIATAIDPADQARRYVAGGASAISVLTEPDFFGGSLEDLVAVRDAVDVPVLRKDFVLDPVQVWEARAAGADAILLIVAALDDRTLESLLALARDVGLAALVEAHTPEEARRAMGVGANIVGVNNRDLTTFVTDLSTAEEIAPIVASADVKVGESGVSDAAGAARMAAAGYDAILVGEALVRADDPAALVAALRSV